MGGEAGGWEIGMEAGLEGIIGKGGWERMDVAGWGGVG